MEASCIVCGCTDHRACDGGCSWAVVDRRAGLGVCSRCDSLAARARFRVDVAHQLLTAAPRN